MFYYASLNPTTKVCISVSQSETQRTTNANLIEISSLDTSLVYRKKYLDGEWVTATPDEAACYKGYEIECNSKWLEELTGDTDDLDTTDKTSLVAAINECFQYASNGKTAIANAITGADSTLEIPTNPTFAQLAALIGQFSGRLKVETGTMQNTTIPATIEGTTTFQPKIVIVYNFGYGLANFNMGVYVSPVIANNTTMQASDSANGLGGTLSRRANCFTVTETGFSMINSGAATNLLWVALG